MTSLNTTSDLDKDSEENLEEGQGHSESLRDFIGLGVLKGIEGTMGIQLHYFGVTEDYQKDIINSIMVKFGTRARTLFQDLIDEAVDEILSDTPDSPTQP